MQHDGPTHLRDALLSYHSDPTDPSNLDPSRPGPHCGDVEHNFDLGAIVIHELAHAYHAGLSGAGAARSLGDEQDAMFTENPYHSAANPVQPTRCEYK